MASRRRSWFAVPGAVIDARVDDSSALAVVMATSRHGRVWEKDDVKADLAMAILDHIGWPEKPDLDGGYLFGWDRALPIALEAVEEAKPHKWYSVTRTEIEQGTHDCGSSDYCDANGSCSYGSGKRWVKVLCVETDVVEGQLDTAHRAFEERNA